MLKIPLRLLLWFVLLGAGAAWAAPLKVRVNNPAQAKFLLARGGRLIADYDSFQLIETDDATLAAAGPVGVQAEEGMNFIELNARRLDTRAPETQAQRTALSGFAGKRLHLVQFAGPIKPEWLSALEQHGAQIVSYLPQNAYLIYGDAQVLGRMQAWARTSAAPVQWEGTYADDYKIHPRARPTDPSGKSQNPGTTFAIQLVEDAAANAATLALIDRLKLEPITRQYHALHFVNLVVQLSPAELTLLAAQPEVVSIQPYLENRKMDERQDQIISGNFTNLAPIGPGYLAWLAGKGFTQAQFNASGFVVDVTDSGMDNGTTSPGHFGLYQSGDPAQASRVVYNRLEGTPHGGSTLEGCDGHGTLNTHIVAGYNNLANGFPHTDAAGFHYGLGVCPFVKVGSSVIFDPSMFTSPNYEDLQSEAYNDGARISANSWGSSVSGAYNSDSQAYDALVRDAQPGGSTYATSGNQEMVIVFASGNDGPAAQTVGSPGTAKNVITVGASENVRSLSTADGGYNSAGDSRCPSDSDLAADSVNDMANFSSRGPCADGRKKPDLVAPGTHITGGVGQDGSPDTNGTGTAIACFDASSVCALPGGGGVSNPNNFFPLGQQFYTVSSGTSHSTPAVAGACALVRQYFINHSLSPPSPAMTKATLMNSARYLNGNGANDSLWSIGQGMGEMNLGVVFDGVPRVLRDQVTAEKFTATGQTHTFTGTIADSTKPFRVTLAWTDAFGSTSGNAFNNNLDLTVTVGGNTYLGNVFNGALSTTGGMADSRNNVESVFLPAGSPATFTVTVTAANINSDGVPNEAPSLDQDFALVVYNGIEGPVPVIKPDTVALVAESCTNGAVDPGETLTVRVALKNTGSLDTTNLMVTLLETNGVIWPSAAQNYGAVLAGGSSVTQTFSFTAVGTCGGTINPLFKLQEGSTVLGTAMFSLPLGLPAQITGENFDGVIAPAWPAGWTTSTSGAQSAWANQTAVRDTVPNAASSGEASNAGVNELLSPSIVLPSGVSQLTFRHSYNLEASSGTVGYDAGVLEIKIGGGSFNDIVAAGGSFITGGYNRVVSTMYSNPLAGRSAWSGNSGGFITTTATLPPAAAGQTIQLRWRCGTDVGVGGSGWRVDTITVNGSVCCLTTMADVSVQKSPALLGVNLGNNATNIITVTNLGPTAAGMVTAQDTLPAGVSFLSATASQGTWTNNAGVISFALGTLTNGTAATLSVRMSTTNAGYWTNVVSISSITPDVVTSNNSASSVILVNTAPNISGLMDQETAEDTPLGPVMFTIGDDESPASSLTLSAVSSDTNLVAPSGIIFGGSDDSRTFTVNPATNQNGVCTITILVSDGLASASNSFTFIVDPVNDPPVLGTPPDRTIHAGSTLVFTNVATDPDLPPDTLTFSVVTNALPGATVDLWTGVFSWTPDMSYADTTNVITIEVSDNGAPTLTDDKSFSVIVLPPPSIQSTSASGGVLTISWSAINGQAYRVQYKNNLNDADWTDVLPDIIAAGSTASANEPMSSSPQRFYRVIVVP